MEEATRKSELRNILPLWDYGWLDHERLELTPFNDHNELLEAYLSSVYFQTSFIGPERDVTPEVHGPFLRRALTASDFATIDADEFMNDYQRVRQPPDFRDAANYDQWKPVEKLIGEVFQRNTWTFRLSLTEDDSEGEKAHEVGWVLGIFREFVFANPETQNVERLVFGYD